MFFCPSFPFFFPPLSEAEMMNIVQFIIKRRGRNPGDQGNGGNGGGGGQSGAGGGELSGREAM